VSWLDKEVSLYNCPADNIGRPATLRDILFTQFAAKHDWFFKHHESCRWISGNYNDLDTIIDLRTREMTPSEKIMLKQTMQCYTPAALLKTKKKGEIEEISRSGLMQLDFDYAAIKYYDIEELKHAVFDLPFVAFCGLSCSGNGFFALVSIAEPYKLKEYAEHCFNILEKEGIPADTTKGRNFNDLRFVSYDANMLVREDPAQLKIKRFNTPKLQPLPNTYKRTTTNLPPLKWALESIKTADVGNRFDTVRKAAYTLGGYGYGLQEIKDAINNCSQYRGVESKYLLHAEEAFSAGQKQPISV
jgi:hypothetical protein